MQRGARARRRPIAEAPGPRGQAVAGGGVGELDGEGSRALQRIRFEGRNEARPAGDIEHVVYENQGIVEILSTDVSRSLEALASRVKNLNRIKIRLMLCTTRFYRHR